MNFPFKHLLKNRNGVVYDLWHNTRFQTIFHYKRNNCRFCFHNHKGMTFKNSSSSKCIVITTYTTLQHVQHVQHYIRFLFFNLYFFYDHNIWQDISYDHTIYFTTYVSKYQTFFPLNLFLKITVVGAFRIHIFN